MKGVGAYLPWGQGGVISEEMQRFNSKVCPSCSQHGKKCSDCFNAEYIAYDRRLREQGEGGIHFWDYVALVQANEAGDGDP